MSKPLASARPMSIKIMLGLKMTFDPELNIVYICTGNGAPCNRDKHYDHRLEQDAPECFRTR